MKAKHPEINRSSLGPRQQCVSCSPASPSSAPTMALRLLLPLLLLAATLLIAQAQGEGHEALLPTCRWDEAGDKGAGRGLCGVLGGAVTVHGGRLQCVWMRAWLRVWGLHCSCVWGGVCVCTPGWRTALACSACLAWECVCVHVAGGAAAPRAEKRSQENKV